MSKIYEDEMKELAEKCIKEWEPLTCIDCFEKSEKLSEYHLCKECGDYYDDVSIHYERMRDYRWIIDKLIEHVRSREWAINRLFEEYTRLRNTIQCGNPNAN